MPTEQEHIRQAEHDEAAYGHLDETTDSFGDWQITALFYAAVHYTNAYLARQGIQPADHDQRRFWVDRESRLRQIRVEYHDLHQRGWQSRYGVMRISRDDARKIYSSAYKPFRDAIRLMLNLPPAE